MMDDNSEAQMETDVSSTTVDVPDTQKVIGTSGDMETVIFVENLKEDQTFPEEETNGEEMVHSGNIHSTQGFSDATSNESALLQTCLRQLPEVEEGEKLKANMNVIEGEKLNRSPSKSNQTALNHISSIIVCPPASKQSTEVISELSSNIINNLPKNIVTCEKENLLKKTIAVDDHQYASKELPTTVEQCDSNSLKFMVSVSEDLNGDCKDENTKLIESEPISKIDDGPVYLEDAIDASNESQMETSSEVSEKDHNRSISRELKSLIKSAKESKIISECTQLTSKTRKSRTPLETSLTTAVEAEKIHGNRRNSTNSQKSNCSEKSDNTIKRSMRSQNPEFVNKVKLFLNSVTGKNAKTDLEPMSDEDSEENKRKESLNDSRSKRGLLEEKLLEKANKLRTDPYCWRCHWVVEQPANEKIHHPMQCTVCPRSYHFKCLSGTERSKITNEKNWVCPECLAVLHAESSETRSLAMKKITLGALCELLKYALERMMDLNGVEPFMSPVDRTAFPDYEKYVVHPMDLSLMKSNIDAGLYGSTEAFIVDAQWILHNSIIFNTLQSKLTAGARALVRSCRAEMGEIEACPECYAAAHARRPTWFTDVCTTPHVLLWAKLKGFPHWPAKGMTVNSTGLVDVRFFGAHDRAWVPAKDCYLYSEKDPNNFRTKRQDIIDSMLEAEQHIRNISRKYGKFVYPPFKTQFDPTRLAEQLKMMIPSFEGEVRSFTREKSTSTPHGKDKSRSNSKSSKSSINDGDMSDGEDSNLTPTRKMADGAEIAKEDDEFTICDKNKTTESFFSSHKRDASRKRRRSDLEEAVMTILDGSGSTVGEKCRRIGDFETNQNTIEGNESLKEKSLVVEGSIGQAEKVAEQINTETTKEKEPSSDLNNTEKSMDTTPGKQSRPKPTTRASTPKDFPKDKNTSDSFSTPKQRPTRNDKAPSEKDDKIKTNKLRNSKHKMADGNNERSEKNGDKKTDRSTDSPTGSKEKKDSNTTNKNKETDSDKNPKKCIVSVKVITENPKAKERKQIDDNTVLADLARSSNNNIIVNSLSGMPTISNVRSLLVPSNDTNPKTKTIEAALNAYSSVFTTTSTDNVRNMKETVSKLQNLRNNDPPQVGRVGVRAFARMTSPEPQPQPQPEPMLLEIKSEPIDIDDTDRQNEKMDLMNAFKLRPVNQTAASNLRDVRINKVVVSPINPKKLAPKQPDIRVRAKKTFPQPKKPDDGRSELNGKNSMVYIPIQPPVSQAPIRGVRPMSVNVPTNPSIPRMPAPTITSASGMNTLMTPLIPHSLSSSHPNSGPITTATSTVLANLPTGVPTMGPIPKAQIPTIGQVPTNVHTVPLITSVNGQWTFSLQPIMSVGGIDECPTPIVNGIAEMNQMPPLSHLNALSSPSQPNVSTCPSISASATASAPTVVTPLPNANTTQGNGNDTPSELPRLQQRPALLNPFDASTPMGCVPPPSTAGPLTAKLNQNAVKLTDFFRTLLEDSLEKIDEPAAHLASFKVQLEQAKWRHQQEIDEIKHNHDLVLAEMRASFEKDKIRSINEVRHAAQIELEAAVKLAKSKQWCAHCSQEAQFYCCWNTSYCDYPCQRAHWSQHYAVCTQQRNQDGNSTENGGPTHDNANLQPDNLPKNTQAPTLTVGNKLTPLRVYSQDPANGQKSSIIVSMVEDSSGNQTMKCVGTYKPSGPPQLSPLNINKPIMTNDDNTKKVTSGGYLIVGAGAAGGGNLVPRRPHTIQYYT